MQRVDEHHGAGEWQANRDAALAEASHNIELGSTGQARLRQPRRDFGEEGFVHAPDYTAGPSRLAGSEMK